MSVGLCLSVCVSVRNIYRPRGACVHDSAPISRPILIKFGTRSTLPREKRQIPSVTQPGVINAHAANFNFSFLTDLFKVSLNVGLHAKCSRLIRNLGR